jgi:hypothetical protein
MTTRDDLALNGEPPQHYGSGAALTYVWDNNAQAWVRATTASVGSAVSVADGADVAQGTTTDPAWVSGAGTTISLLKTIASSGAAAGLTDAQLRASPVPVSGTVSTGGLTDTQLRASAVPVSGTVTASGPLTDTQLRASAVPVSGPLTDTQLRASAVPVSGSVTANAGTNLNTSLLALEAGGNLAAIKADVDKIPAQGQALAAASMPVVLTAAQVTTLTPPAAITGFALDSTVAKDSSLTTLDTDLKAAQPRKIQDSAGASITVGQKVMATSLPVVLASDQSAVPTTVASLPLPAGAALEAGNLASVLVYYLQTESALLTDIRTELRILNMITTSGLNVRDDPATYRNDPDLTN